MPSSLLFLDESGGTHLHLTQLKQVKLDEHNAAGEKNGFPESANPKRRGAALSGIPVRGGATKIMNLEKKSFGFAHKYQADSIPGPHPSLAVLVP